MSRFFRISEITRPSGPVSKSKLYADARAGRIELRRIGGTTIVTEAAWAAYVSGKPVEHKTKRAA